MSATKGAKRKFDGQDEDTAKKHKAEPKKETKATKEPKKETRIELKKHQQEDLDRYCRGDPEFDKLPQQAKIQKIEACLLDHGGYLRCICVQDSLDSRCPFHQTHFCWPCAHWTDLEEARCMCKNPVFRNDLVLDRKANYVLERLGTCCAEGCDTIVYEELEKDDANEAKKKKKIGRKLCSKTCSVCTSLKEDGMTTWEEEAPEDNLTPVILPQCDACTKTLCTAHRFPDRPTTCPSCMTQFLAGKIDGECVQCGNEANPKPREKATVCFGCKMPLCPPCQDAQADRCACEDGQVCCRACECAECGHPACFHSS